MANRLDLDFSIESAEERNIFLTSYLQESQFKEKPLTPTELETCAKYLLYGKDEDGTSCVQRGEVQVETKNKTWSNEGKFVSLEALLDTGDSQGGSYEDIILRPHQVNYKNIRQTFSREDALKKAPKILVPVFTDLFKQIDETELVINYYEILVGKRTKEPRAELIARVGEEQAKHCKQTAALLSQYQYLKKKHMLVDLRRQQYTLRDSYQPTFQTDWKSRGAPIVDETVLTFDCDMEVFPLGLKAEGTTSGLIFQDFNELYPQKFTEEQMEKISKRYWQKKNCKKDKFFFDFADLEHVYQLILSYADLRAVVENGQEADSTTSELLETLLYYENCANLTEIQKEILTLKKQQVKNKDIKEQINSKYGTTYNENYISTIFRQKIIKQINEAAEFHKEIISNIFFPEEFKKCTSCGKYYLICSKNFVKKSRAKDGYTNRCKACDKIYRQKGR